MCMLTDIELTQTLEKSIDLATQTLILTYLALTLTILDDISESQRL